MRERRTLSACELETCDTSLRQLAAVLEDLVDGAFTGNIIEVAITEDHKTEGKYGEPSNKICAARKGTRRFPK